MTERRPPLRLVGAPDDRHATDADSDFDPVDRAPHDRHPPYRELAVVEDATDVDAAEDDPQRAALSPRFAIAALIVLQALAVASFWGKYAALAHGEDQYKFAAVLSGLASLCLYAGAALLALRPGRGRGLFIAAAAGLGLSLPAWGVGYGWSWPIAFGATLALAGAWFARPEVRPDASSEAQP